MRRHPDDLDLGLGRSPMAGGGGVELRAAADQGRRREQAVPGRPDALLDDRLSAARAVLLALPPLGGRDGAVAVLRVGRRPRGVRRRDAPRSISTSPTSRASSCACATSPTTAGAIARRTPNTMQAAIQALADASARARRSDAGALEGAAHPTARSRAAATATRTRSACRSSRRAAARSPTTPAASSRR